MKNLEQNIKNKAEDVDKAKDVTTNRRVFIEIGSGFLPYGKIGSRKFKGNDIYVGVEKNRSNINLGGDNDKEGNISFIEADGQKLPFSDNSVEEVFLGNVLGDGRIPENTIRAFLSESRRVLKTGGQIVILETYTPKVASTLGHNNEAGVVKTLDDFIKDHGFSKVKEIRPSDSGFQSEFSKYRGNFLKAEHDNYILYFVKD